MSKFCCTFAPAKVKNNVYYDFKIKDPPGASDGSELRVYRFHNNR